MTQTEASDHAVAREGELPLLARFVNHILTPGSSLTPTVWITFNVIMAVFFVCWLPFVISMPGNIHVWVFGFLALGLLVSTNWFMRLIFATGQDFHSQQAQAEAAPLEAVPGVDDVRAKRD